MKDNTSTFVIQESSGKYVKFILKSFLVHWKK